MSEKQRMPGDEVFVRVPTTVEWIFGGGNGHIPRAPLRELGPRVASWRSFMEGLQGKTVRVKLMRPVGEESGWTKDGEECQPDDVWSAEWPEATEMWFFPSSWIEEPTVEFKIGDFVRVTNKMSSLDGKVMRVEAVAFMTSSPLDGTVSVRFNERQDSVVFSFFDVKHAVDFRPWDRARVKGDACPCGACRFFLGLVCEVDHVGPGYANISLRGRSESFLLCELEHVGIAEPLGVPPAASWGGTSPSPAPGLLDLDQARAQLAGCFVAAEGNAAGANDAKPGDYGWSPAFEKVKTLRRERDLYAKDSYSLANLGAYFKTKNHYGYEGTEVFPGGGGFPGTDDPAKEAIWRLDILERSVVDRTKDLDRERALTSALRAERDAFVLAAEEGAVRRVAPRQPLPFLAAPGLRLVESWERGYDAGARARVAVASFIGRQIEQSIVVACLPNDCVVLPFIIFLLSLPGLILLALPSYAYYRSVVWSAQDEADAIVVPAPPDPSSLREREWVDARARRAAERARRGWY